jgi:hypothetical protein
VRWLHHRPPHPCTHTREGAQHLQLLQQAQTAPACVRVGGGTQHVMVHKEVQQLGGGKEGVTLQPARAVSVGAAGPAGKPQGCTRYISQRKNNATHSCTPAALRLLDGSVTHCAVGVVRIPPPPPALPCPDLSKESSQRPPWHPTDTNGNVDPGHMSNATWMEVFVLGSTSWTKQP